METFFDTRKMRNFIEQAIKHYEKGPAWFIDWLDDLYIRTSEDIRTITLDEVLTLAQLHSDNEWMAEPLAVNTAYKLFDRLGRDTSGILGY